MRFSPLLSTLSMNPPLCNAATVRPPTVLLLLVVTGVALCSFAVAGDEKSEKNEGHDRAALFADALEHYRQQRYRAALAIVDRLELENPDRPLVGEDNLYNFKGSCLTALRYFQHARKEFQRALEAQPSSFDMKFNLAEIDFLQEHFERARTAFTELADTDTGRSYTNFIAFKTAMCRLMLGEESAALADISLHARTSAPYLFMHAAAALRLGKQDKAELLFFKAREYIASQDFELYQDSLIECGLLAPP
ncbi:MAG: hypothetical protein ACC661_06670, partial [Verrucomicrobiales bacterium]